MADDGQREGKPGTGSHRQHEQRMAWGWWVFAAIALFYLVAEHRAHLFGVLPFLLLLACPAMHLFMHHGNHHGHGAGSNGDKEDGGK